MCFYLDINQKNQYGFLSKQLEISDYAYGVIMLIINIIGIVIGVFAFGVIWNVLLFSAAKIAVDVLVWLGVID
jgi:hypothetical protein